MNTVLKLLVLSFMVLGAPAMSYAKCTPGDPFEQEGCLKPYPAPHSRLTCFNTSEQPELFTVIDNQPQPGLATLMFADGSSSTAHFSVEKTQQQTRWIDTFETKTYVHAYFIITLKTEYVSYEPSTQTGVYLGNIAIPKSTAKDTAKAIHCITN